MADRRLPDDAVLSREQVREVDRVAIEEFGLLGIVLMENAGRNSAELLRSIGISGRVVVCCGKGNNGGDGFVIARHLEIAGIDVRVLLAADPSSMTGDAATNLQVLQKARIPLVLPTANWQEEFAGADWIVDALLGTGTQSGPSPEEAGSLLELSRGGRAPVVIGGGESRTFLEDGDTIIFRAWCEKPGAARIGFGEVRGSVLEN